MAAYFTVRRGEHSNKSEGRCIGSTVDPRATNPRVGRKLDHQFQVITRQLSFSKGFCREICSTDLPSYTLVPGISIFGYIVISFKGRHHQQYLILQCVRWYVAYSLSYRDLEELMQERGYGVDHSTIHRWLVHYSPCIEKVFRKNKKRTGLRWRLDETCIKIKGQWKYLYRAVDKQGSTVDFLLTDRRDKKAALRFLNKAIGSNGKPSLINIDKSGANTAGIKQYNSDEKKVSQFANVNI